MRHRTPVRRATTQRRKLVWAETGGTQTPGTIASQTNVNVDLLANYRSAGGSTQGITIIRTHLTYQLFTHSAINSTDGISLGLIIGDAGALPTELNTANPFLDWMFISNRYPGMGSVAPSGTGFISGGELDLKAKRKCQELQQTYWMCLSDLTANVQDVSYIVRTLIALP